MALLTSQQCHAAAVAKLLECRGVLRAMLLPPPSCKALHRIITRTVAEDAIADQQSSSVRISKKPIRSKHWVPEPYDPDDPAMHVEFYEPLRAVQQDDIDGASGSSVVLEQLAPTYLVRHQRDDGRQVAGMSLQDKKLRMSGGYMLSPDQGLQMLQPSQPLTTRQLLGMGPAFDEEYLAGPDYRYHVDDEGRILDMVLLKREHIPEPFAHAIPAGWRPDAQAQGSGTAAPRPSGPRSKPAQRSQPVSNAARSTAAPPFSSQPRIQHNRSRAPSRAASRDAAAWDLEDDWEEQAGEDDGGYLKQPAPPASQPGPGQYLKPGSMQAASGDDDSRRSQQLQQQPGRSSAATGSSRGSSSGGGAGEGGQLGGGMVLRAFTYCMGPSDVFNTLWDLDLLQQVQFVADIKDADFVLHRKQRPGERQFSYDQLRKLASSRSIPFVSVWDPGSAAELLRALTPVFQLYRGEVLPCQVARKSAQGYTSKRLRL